MALYSGIWWKIGHTQGELSGIADTHIHQDGKRPLSTFPFSDTRMEVDWE